MKYKFSLITRIYRQYALREATPKFPDYKIKQKNWDELSRSMIIHPKMLILSISGGCRSQDYPSVIASLGHTDAQLPQLMHVSGSMW